MVQIVKIICGVDEAGRGPIIGPLVMAGVSIHETDVVKLEELGVKDSKLLSKEKREEFFEKIKEIVLDYKIVVLEPIMVDAALEDPNLNLNWLEANTSAEIVNQLRPNQVIVDCPSVNVSVYKDYFRSKLSRELNEVEAVVEHKADMNYVVVGAASILAKVVRDREIGRLKSELGAEFGSGYLTDEKTQEFLKKNFDNKNCEGLFRKTWQPYKDLIKAKGQKTLGNF